MICLLTLIVLLYVQSTQNLLGHDDPITTTSIKESPVRQSLLHYLSGIYPGHLPDSHLDQAGDARPYALKTLDELWSASMVNNLHFFGFRQMATM